MATKAVEAKQEAGEDEFFDFSTLTEEQLKAEEERIVKIKTALEHRRKEFANKAFIDIETAMKAAGITPRRMIAYLQPKADLEGVDIRYTYKDPKGNAKTFDYAEGKRGSNPLRSALETGTLSKDDALPFALTEKGKNYITEWAKK